LLFAGAGLAAAIVALLLIVLVEAGVLRWLRWGTFRRSLLGSLAANGASNLVGLVALGLMAVIGVAWFLVVAFVASVGLEGMVLWLLNQSEPRKSWLGALIANVLTYIPMAVVYWVLVS
jgi:hypothetical protein